MSVPRGNLGSLNSHSLMFRVLIRLSLDPISDARGRPPLLLAGEVRKRETLQIQAETVGRADQKKKAERRNAKYRSQDLSKVEKQRAQGRP